MVVKIKQQLHCSHAPLIADPRHVDFIRLRLGESLPEAHKTGCCISPSRGGQFSCVDAHARVTLTFSSNPTLSGLLKPVNLITGNSSAGCSRLDNAYNANRADP